MLRLGGQRPSAGDVLGQTDHRVLGQLGAERVVEAVLHQRHGKMRDIYADPAPLQALGDGDGGTASAERIGNDIAFVAAGTNDAFK